MGILLGLGMLILLMRDLNNRMAELRRLQFESDQVSVQYTQMIGTRNALQTEVEDATQVLDQRGLGGKNNLGQPGDVLIVPVPVGGATPSPTPNISVAATPAAKWELWLAMFFDSKP